MMGVDGLYIPPSQVSMDPATAALYAFRLSQIKCDKLLLAHQDPPILEGAQNAVEQAAKIATSNLKS